MLRKALEAELDECEPEEFVELLRTPTDTKFTALKKKLKNGDKEWTHGFLNSGGLDVLLDAVDVISSRRVTKLSAAMTLFACVSCITKLVNSQTGLSFFVQHGSYTKRLAKGKNFRYSTDLMLHDFYYSNYSPALSTFSTLIYYSNYNVFRLSYSLLCRYQFYLISQTDSDRG
jgi:hypothetical protein